MQHEEVSFFARWLGTALPRPAATPFAAGLAALDAERWTAALGFFATALAEAEDGFARARIRNKCALAHLGLRDRSAAVAALTAALTDDGRCVPAIVNLGNLLLEDGVFDDAIAHYKAALRIDDGYAAAHLNLGIAYKRLGRQTEAVREFRRADRLEARRRRT